MAEEAENSPLERIGRLRTQMASGRRSSLWAPGLLLAMLLCAELTVDWTAPLTDRELLVALKSQEHVRV